MLSLWALGEAAIASMPDRLTGRTAVDASIQGVFDIVVPRFVVDPKLQQIHATEFYLGALRLPFVPPVVVEIVKFARPRFNGTGSFSANVTARLQAQARFAGAGSFFLGATQPGQVTGAARFAGSGSLSAHILKVGQVEAAERFAGTGSYSVNIRQRMQARANLSGAGLLRVDVTQVSGAEALLLSGDESGDLLLSGDESGSLLLSGSF
jgi:hypothetical protein